MIRDFKPEQILVNMTSMEADSTNIIRPHELKDRARSIKQDIRATKNLGPIRQGSKKS